MYTDCKVGQDKDGGDEEHPALMFLPAERADAVGHQRNLPCDETSKSLFAITRGLAES